MKYAFALLKYALVSFGIFTYGLSNATTALSLQEQAKITIEQLYHRLDTRPNISMSQRLEVISSSFINKPYILGSLGEGVSARYDQFPLYRTDGFDCDTYVNTVIALALANSFESFTQCLKGIRYKNGQISYIKRNHFTSIDWNKNNQKRGILKDITLEIKDQSNKPVAELSKTLIDKAGWYKAKNKDSIRLINNTEQEQDVRLRELKAKGEQLISQRAQIAYIPLAKLFPQPDKPDYYLFNQIPDGAIIEIVRPNWDLRDRIGTALDVSHLGFVFKIKNQLYFRQASSQYAKIVTVPLIDYLQDALKSPTIKGINIQVVVPDKPVVDTQCQL
ncbi:MAG: N-acetylmuramoyl-L-alanine amidase-like domain-containing protein [Legionella sp.]